MSVPGPQVTSGRSFTFRRFSPGLVGLLAGTALCSVAPRLALAAEAIGTAASGASAASTPAPAQQALGYTTHITPTGNAAVDSGMSASSNLVALQKTHGVGGYALSGRIRDDFNRIDGALQSQGYYQGKVQVSVAFVGQKMDGRDPLLPDRLHALPSGTKVDITVSATLGPQFTIGAISLTTPPPPQPVAPSTDTVGGPRHQPTVKGAVEQATPVTLSAAEQHSFGLASGQPAVAGDILAAQGRLQTLLLEEGHATATVSTPLAYLRPDTKHVDLVFRVQKGPVVVIGPIALTGLKGVNPGFLRRRLTIHEGQLYQPSVIEAARQDMAGIGVFSSVQARNAPPIVTLGPGLSQVAGVSQAMPVAFSFTEAKRHTVAAQLGYSTDLGGRAGVSWTHHNLFGNAEQLKLTALVTGLGGSAQQGLGYDVYADFLKPDFLGRGRNLSARLEGVKQDLYSYNQTALLGRVGITQRLGRFWNVAGSLSWEEESIRQFGDRREYSIVSIPLSATYDSTQLVNPIDPATHGIRGSFTATPSESLRNPSAFFTILTAQVATYFDLTHLGISRPGRSVIAVRGMVGSVQGASTYQLPPDQRLYAGGPATIRGFRYQGVGPQFGNTKYAIGGTSLDAGSVEYRQRILKSFGMATFVDAGQVGTSSAPGHGTLRVGYGAGVRYYTPIGPVRVDVALPANRPPQGDKWELYIGLGETF